MGNCNGMFYDRVSRRVSASRAHQAALTDGGRLNGNAAYAVSSGQESRPEALGIAHSEGDTRAKQHKRGSIHVKKPPYNPGYASRRGASSGNEGASSVMKWTQGERIGKGTFGEVYLGLNQDTGSLMAIKALSFDRADKEQMTMLRRETNLMK